MKILVIENEPGTRAHLRQGPAAAGLAVDLLRDGKGDALTGKEFVLLG